MQRYIDQNDGQIIELLDDNATIISDGGVWIPAVRYRCINRNMEVTESTRRFNAIYRKRVDMPDTGE